MSVKKWISCILAVAFCFSLTACGTSSETSSSSESASQESSSEEIQYISVTFKQDGQEDIVKTVEKGGILTDIPTPAKKTGYNVYWDCTDFTNIIQDITITVREEAKTYTITLDSNGGSVSQSKLTVTYGEEYQLPVATHVEKDFDCWIHNGIMVPEEGVWKKDADDGTFTLIAMWEQDSWSDNH